MEDRPNFYEVRVNLAYHMLVPNSPYRYARPAPTTEKLRRLRLRSGGTRRKTGSAKGTWSVAKLPGGSRTAKALHVLYVEEGVPDLQPAAPGEVPVQQRGEVKAFVASLSKLQVRARLKTPSAQSGVQPDER